MFFHSINLIKNETLFSLSDALMVGPQRKQRKPTIPRLSGADNKSITELKSDEENKQRRKKVPHYAPKKKVILLPGPVLEQSKQSASREK